MFMILLDDYDCGIPFPPLLGAQEVCMIFQPMAVLTQTDDPLVL